MHNGTCRKKLAYFRPDLVMYVVAYILSNSMEEANLD